MSTKVSAEYDETSPFTGKKDVMIEHQDDGVHKFCLVTGFTTRHDWTPGSKAALAYEEYLTPAAIEKKYIDVNNNVWYPLSMSTTKGVLYFDKEGKDEYVWRVCPTVPTTEEEQKKYNDNKEKLNLDLAVTFKEGEFSEALTEFYKIDYSN